MCEAAVWARLIIGEGSIKAGLNWAAGSFGRALMGDQRAGDPPLTARQRQAITCLSALYINPSGAGRSGGDGDKGGGGTGWDSPRVSTPHPPSAPLCAAGGGMRGGGGVVRRMLAGSGARRQGIVWRVEVIRGFGFNLRPSISSSCFWRRVVN